MTRHLRGTRAVPCVALLYGLLATTSAVAADQSLVERGRYLVAIMDCAGCHTTGALLGQPDPQRYLAGSSIGFEGPPPPGMASGAVVYPPNLTPDPQTGLGSWSDEEILAAVRFGRGRGGRVLAPIMPWPSYASLNDDDGQALVAYLRSIPAVSHPVPAPVPPGTEPTDPYLSLVIPGGS